jgi:hypothetical protein
MNKNDLSLVASVGYSSSSVPTVPGATGDKPVPSPQARACTGCFHQAGIEGRR